MDYHPIQEARLSDMCMGVFQRGPRVMLNAYTVCLPHTCKELNSHPPASQTRQRSPSQQNQNAKSAKYNFGKATISPKTY